MALTAAEIASLVSSSAALLTAVGSLLYQRQKLKELEERTERQFKLDWDIHRREHFTYEEQIYDWLPPNLQHCEEEAEPGYPYVVGPPVKDPNMFFGRQKEIREVLCWLAGPVMNSVQVLGMRRSGKTSFLHYLAYTLESQKSSHYLPVYLDAQTRYKDPGEFYSSLLRRTTDTMERLARPPSRPPLPPCPAPFSMVENTLLQYSKAGWKIILMLDEVETLMERPKIFDDIFFGTLRSLISSQDLSVAWVTSSVRSISQPGGVTSPFSNIIPNRIYLGGLTDEEALELVRKPAQDLGIMFTEQEINFILDLAGRMPYALQKAALLVYKERLMRNPLSNYRKSVEQTFQNEMAPTYQAHVKCALEEELLALNHLIQGKTLLMPDRVNLDELCRYGLISKNSDQYQIPGTTYYKFLQQYDFDLRSTH
jgi:hypothetical protein